MIVVNGVNIETYDPDTQQTLQSRIAAAFKTLPKYVYWKEEEKEFVDILNIIRNISTMDFAEVLQQTTRYNPNLKPKEDILYLWLIENRYLNQLLAQPRMISDSIKYSIQLNVKDYLNENEFENFLRFRRQEISDKLQREILQNQKRDQQIRRQYSQFARIEEGLLHTPFLTERVGVQLRFQHESLSLLEIFDNARPSPFAPILQAGDYIKIFQEAKILDEWLYETEPTLVLRLWSKTDLVTDKADDYMEVRVIDHTENMVTFESYLQTTRGYLSPAQFQARLAEVFGGKLTVLDAIETKVLGVFFFPGVYLDSYVFSDLVMLDDLFSSMMSIDESKKSTKKKSADGQSWLHAHFRHLLTGDITVSINQRYTEGIDPELRELPADYRELFTNQSPYVRIRVTKAKISSR